jgi:DNA-binding NtrC family response regulator
MLNMATYTIYVVDDETTVREGIALSLEHLYDMRIFPRAEPAIEAMQATPPDLILLDIGLPGLNGIDALAKIKQNDPQVPVIMITAYEDVKTVLSAMKQGAYDYIIKPIRMEELEVAITNALGTIRLRKEVQMLQERYLRENLPFFIRESNEIQDVLNFMTTVAKSPDTPILIVGETGTGKEWIANAIHYKSPNFRGPLITVNCAAFPKELIESELFGYEKGAFSGASPGGKKGLIEQSGGGTLFLDEIGDLSIEAQAKLLRFLESGDFYRVGGTCPVKVRTRLVSATNKDLMTMMDEGGFRKDLYYRLGVIRIQVPPLNSRREDILPLAKHFLLEFNRKFDKQLAGFTAEAKQALLGYHFEGNVRQLKNIIERSVLTGRGSQVTPADLDLSGQGRETPYSAAAAKAPFPPLAPDGIDLAALEKRMERYYIETAYAIAGGNESHAARLLGLNHHTYRYRRKKLTQP